MQSLRLSSIPVNSHRRSRRNELHRFGNCFRGEDGRWFQSDRGFMEKLFGAGKRILPVNRSWWRISQIMLKTSSMRVCRTFPRKNHSVESPESRWDPLPEGCISVRGVGHEAQHRVYQAIRRRTFGGEGFILQGWRGWMRSFRLVDSDQKSLKIRPFGLIRLHCRVFTRIHYDIQRAGA